jgi:predicted Zn-dependent protease
MTRLTLALDRAQDGAAVRAAIEAMRRDLSSLPADPYLLYATDATHSEVRRDGTLAVPRDAVDDVLAAAGSADLVGILASGPVYRGFANSLGARHWHQVDSFLFDWSLVAAGDKAVKCSWAGSAWDRTELQRRWKRRARSCRCSPGRRTWPRRVNTGRYSRRPPSRTCCRC